jgi:hypothetical protein
MSANTGQRLMMTGGTFALTWGILQHGGEGAIIAAVLASVVLSNADKIVDKFTGGSTSPQPADDDYPTEEEIAAYRSMIQAQQQRQGQLPPGTSAGDDEEYTDDESDLGALLGRDGASSDFQAKPQRMFTYSDLLATGYRPSLDKLFMARLEDGKHVFSTAKRLVHCALTGPTGKGKSNIMRMLMLELCASGAQVLLLNPHWTPYDSEADEDWTPFIPYLARDPGECAYYDPRTRMYPVIEECLHKAAIEILPARLKRRAQGKPVGKPIFIFLDELPAIMAGNPNTADYLSPILQQGRKVGIYLVGAACTFLLSAVGGDSGMRDQYCTVFYAGGDNQTLKALLDKKPSDVNERILGKGVVLFRNLDVLDATLAYVPFVDNEALYVLLGPSTRDQIAVDEDDTSEDTPITEEMRTDLAEIESTPYRNESLTDAELIEMGADAYRNGHTSISQLSAALDIKMNRARRLQQFIKTRVEKLQSEQGGK